jgi:hypothetical protein
VSLIGEQTDIVFQARQTVVFALIIEQTPQLDFRRCFACFLLSGSVAPNDTNAGLAEDDFAFNHFHSTVFEIQSGQVRLEVGSGFGCGSDTGIAPVASGWPYGSVHFREENRQVRLFRRLRQQDSVAIDQPPAAIGRWNSQHGSPILHLDMHECLASDDAAHRLHPRMNKKSAMQTEGQIFVKQMQRGRLTSKRTHFDMPAGGWQSMSAKARRYAARSYKETRAARPAPITPNNSANPQRAGVRPCTIHIRMTIASGVLGALTQPRSPYQTVISCSNVMLKRSWTRLLTTSIKRNTSRVLAPG